MNNAYKQARSALRFALFYLIADLVLFALASALFIIYLNKFYLAVIALVLCFLILVVCIFEVFLSCFRCVCKCGVIENKLKIKLDAYLKKYYFERKDCVSIKEKKKFYTVRFKSGRVGKTFYFYKQVKGETAFTLNMLEKLTGLKREKHK